MTTTNGTAVVNGKTYTVKNAFRTGAGVIELIGPRGGSAVLVQNVPTGRWTLLTMQGYRAKETPVHSMEVRS
jgi:hypothetical protein